MPYGYGSANRRGPSGPAGGASAGGNYGGNRNPQQTYGGRSTPVTTGGPPSVLNPPTKKTTPVTTGGPPIVLNPPTKKTTPVTTPVTTGGQSPFPYTRRVGITSNYMNPTFRKAAIDRVRQYQLANRPTSFLGNLQNLYGQGITQIGYVPKSLEPKKSLKKTAWDYATTEGVDAQKFADWRKTEPASLFEEYHSDYGDQLQRELELSGKIKTLGEDYVKSFDIKGIGDSYDDQRKAVDTLLGDVETKKSALKDSDKDWMLNPTNKLEKDMLNRELTGDYEKNKDRLDDLGITSMEQYKNFINKAVGLARGGIVDLYRYGGFIG